ncbi:MAG TPA: hypothetical protein VNA69_03575, partial [Thermoanaerobaculia bacterium]|nr:hypothetical protein [Thermoanaerobaculia bacterium]
GHGGQVLVSTSTATLLELELRDLGEHRFKDLSAPERVYQLGEGEFPALKSLYRTNLPVPATPFLGRERELREVVELLASTRLLTLTGPGGTGKTRLAAQAAGLVSEGYPDGVWWIPLAPLRDPMLVLETASQAVGSTNGLAEHIQDKAILCLFDNFEQVVEAAPDLAALVGACPNLDLLVTSREPLHVSGEQEYAVPPLRHEEGVGFFLARARAVKPEFAPDQAVSEICACLDDLPLALELAAARVKALSPAQILERLGERLPLLTGGARDLPERQRTLHATIAWSYDLLSEEEQRLFGCLAVFRGGCAIEAAEEVCAGAADLDTLQSLVDKSLVRFTTAETGSRYWMLETIREYAGERLGESDEEEAIRDRHLAHILALAERAYEERLASMSMWFPILDAEHDNIRAALDWATIRDPRAEAQLAGAIAFYWYLRGHAREARERVAGSLERYPQRDSIRARALTHLGELSEEVGLDTALSYLGEAVDIWHESGDVVGEATALEMIGYFRIQAGEQESARAIFEQSLALRQQAGASDLEASRALGGLCQALVSSGEIERAETMAQELYELGVRNDATRPQQSALHYLADCPLIGGDYAEAERRYARAVAHARSSGILVMCATDLVGVAMSAAGRGNHARAVRLAAAAYAQLETFGFGDQPPAHFWTRLQEWFIGGARAQLTPEELDAAERAGSEADF